MLCLIHVYKFFALREVVINIFYFSTWLHAKILFSYSSLIISHLLLIIFIGLALGLLEVSHIQLSFAMLTLQIKYQHPCRKRKNRKDQKTVLLTSHFMWLLAILELNLSLMTLSKKDCSNSGFDTICNGSLILRNSV